MLARIVLSGALLALAAALVVTLATDSVHRTGSNGVGTVSFAPLEPHAEACQEGQVLPAGTATVAIGATVERAPTPPLTLRVRRGGRTLEAGRVPGGWPTGTVRFRVDRVTDGADDATICLRNRGSRRVQLLGDGGLVRYDFYEGGERSWFSFMGTVRSRLAQGGSSWIGVWWFWPGLALLAAVIGLTAIAFLRSLGGEADDAR